MKDYLNTFDEDTTKSLYFSMELGYGLKVAEIIHNPTGICCKETSFLCPDMELLDIAEGTLKKKLKDHYEQEELKRAVKEAKGCSCDDCVRATQINLKKKAEESKRFSDFLKDRCTITDLMLGKTKEKESKKPLHPTEVATQLLLLNCCTLCCFENDNLFANVLDTRKASELLNIPESYLKEFIKQNHDMDWMMAFKLAKAIEGTDIRFWMDLQERYDSYKWESK